MKNRNRIHRRHDSASLKRQPLPTPLKNAWSAIVSHIWKAPPHAFQDRLDLFGAAYWLIPKEHTARKRLGRSWNWLCQHALACRLYRRDHGHSAPKGRCYWERLASLLPGLSAQEDGAARRAKRALVTLLEFYRPEGAPALLEMLNRPGVQERSLNPNPDPLLKLEVRESREELSFEQRERCREALQVGAGWRDVKCPKWAQEFAEGLEEQSLNARSNNRACRWAGVWATFTKEMRLYVASEWENRAMAIRRLHGLPPRGPEGPAFIQPIELPGPRKLYRC